MALDILLNKSEKTKIKHKKKGEGGNFGRKPRSPLRLSLDPPHSSLTSLAQNQKPSTRNPTLLDPGTAKERGRGWQQATGSGVMAPEWLAAVGVA